MRKKLLFFSLALTFSFLAYSQSDTNQTENPAYHRKSAAALLSGVPGIGMEYAYNLNPHFNLRARGTYFRLSQYELQYTMDGRTLDIFVDLDALMIDLLAEYLPFRRSSFKIVGGVSYVQDFGGSALILLHDNVKFGEVEMEPEQVGKMNVGLSYSGIAPYMGIGFGRAVPKKRIGIGVDIGTHYAGPPDFTVTATELLEPTGGPEQEENLEKAFDSFRWLPSFLIKVSVRLN